MQPLDIKQFHLRAMLMSSFGLCSRAPGQIKGSGVQKQRPQELLATL